MIGPPSVMASTVRKIEGGDLDASVQVDSCDEVGVLGEGVNSMVSTLREREHILGVFGRVVEPDVRDRLLSGNLELGGETRVATVLFVDLRGFTALAEQSSPQEVVATLNRFFGVMSQWVHECGGFVDKFIGDAMLVVFGLFDEDREDGAHASSARAALQCALGMRERLAELNAERAGEGRTSLAMSLGIHTGEIVAGTIGAEDRHEYTVIGDSVNVAARVQQLCRETDRDILVTAESMETAGTDGYRAESIGDESVTLRGRERAVTIFALA